MLPFSPEHVFVKHSKRYAEEAEWKLFYNSYFDRTIEETRCYTKKDNILFNSTKNSITDSNKDISPFR